MLGMSDLVNGVSVLLAFYVGYRYGLKISKEKQESSSDEKPKEKEAVSLTHLLLPWSSTDSPLPFPGLQFPW